MKLLPARFMLEQAVEHGLLKSGGTICESSSGTFGLALAMLAVQYGYKLVLVSDWSLDRQLHKRLVELGARVEIVDRPASSGGLQQARLDRLAEYLKEIPDSYWPSQYSNKDNPLAYGKFAEALVERLGKIDALVGPVGSGGSMCGTTKFLRHIFPALHAIAVDAANSILFGQPAGKNVVLSGLGGAIVPYNVDHRQFDETHWLTPTEIFQATHHLHQTHGLFMGPTSGAAYRVADWWSRKNPGKNVVAIFPDEGHRYVETVYDENWLSSIPGWPTSIRQEPVTVETPAMELTGWSSYPWCRRTLREVLSAKDQSRGSNSERQCKGTLSFDVGRCATLKALPHFDSTIVAHLELKPEQEEFVEPLDAVFSKLRNSSSPQLEHPFSVVVGNEVVAFFILREKAALPEWAPPDVITLHNLRVGRSYQGQGYGKLATRLAAQWILENRPGIKRLMLAVNVRNVTAIQLYVESGFQGTGAVNCGPVGPQNILHIHLEGQIQRHGCL
ncbi:pyridoxal-phosphate dependent enzyme [Bradyrhizobium sp. 186]|uniref:pyridoxal-phosphate dependent enzyme n=1 Tax=Bradyrhizobium sp. 186 TaxID=2782654 RepID=UPI002112788E|nr:pyridoxal-phosphate dependent enzyme [Bradyrhizobium sp. 186]